MKPIIGSGGGKSGSGSSRTAQEAENTLRSKSYAMVLDLISEGEIEGPVEGLQSIFLNDTPLVGADGSTNFSGVSVDFRSGTQDQPYINGFPSSEHEVSVGIEVKSTSPVTRAISNSLIDAIVVRISIPQLTEQNTSNGDLNGSEVSFAIEVNSNGAGWVQKANDTIRGKCVSKYEKEYRISFAGLTGPHEVRIRKVTPDSTVSHIVNKIFWSSYTEVVDAKLRYPNSAIVALRVDAENFDSIPTRSYDMKLMRIRVPSNYDPLTRDYVGIWNGSFKIAWSDNPAWIFYDLVTNERYGLGAHIDQDLVDKWGLYKIAQYCDQLVPDGNGGTEPRFTCNTYLQTRTEAFNLIKDLASVFRAIAYWSAGVLTLSQDSPQDPAFLFNPSNVIGGSFEYQGTSRSKRYNVALVTWNDPDDMFRPKVEYVEDAEAIQRFGVIQTEVTAFACTSRGQAHRFGKWLIYTSQLETETVTFQTGVEGLAVRPGQIIRVADPVRAGRRMGGRVRSATTTSIVVDKGIDIDGEQLSISVMLPNGEIATRLVTSISDNEISISPSAPFAEPPAPHAVWAISSAIVESQTFRVVSVVQDGLKHTVTAVSHNPSKFDFIERDLILSERKISSLSITPDAPSGLKVVETLYEVNGEVRVKATFSWSSVNGATSYVAEYREETGNTKSLGNTQSNEIEILDIDPGNYEFSVLAQTSLGKKSSKSSTSYRVLGKAFPPASVADFSLIPVEGTAYLSWRRSADLDVLLGGYVRIRFSPNNDATWRDSVDVANLAGSQTRAQVPLMNGVYLAKFVDSSGNASVEASSIVTSALQATKLNIVMTLQEHLPDLSGGFEGTKENMIYMPFYEGLLINAPNMIDDVPDIDSIPSFDFLGGVSPSGTYYFAETADLGEIFTCNVKALIDTTAIDVADTIDQRVANIDDWLDLDGEYIDDVNAELFLQTTLDDPSDSDANWTPWKPFFVGSYTARAFRFKVVAKSGSDFHNIVLKKLAVSIDMPDRTVNLAGIVSNTGPTDITFEAAFADVPAIGITAFDMQSGDHYLVENKTASGFRITFKNNAGAAVQRTFDVIAKGYGRRV